MALPVAWFAELTVAFLSQEADTMAPFETGGVLMGYTAGADVVVTRAVGPGPRATHKRTCFVPDAEFQEKEIARIYDESRRMYTYLGDWHTHPPARSAVLSLRDRLTLRRIARSPAARIPLPLMALAFNSQHWHFGVFRYVPFTRSPFAFGLGSESMEMKIFDSELFTL